MSLSARDIMNNLAQKKNVLKEVSDEERKRLQGILLSCMKDLHNACNAIGIRYSLVGGSALGAVRHKGFIPWDDDMDVMMLRDDWEKFKIFFTAFLGAKYELEAPNYQDKDTKNVWGKMYLKGTRMVELQDINMPYEKGAFIDIFIYDAVSDNPLIRFFDAKIIHFLNGVSNSMLLYRYPNDLIRMFYGMSKETLLYYKARRFLGFLFSIVSHKTLCNFIDKFQSRHNGRNIVTSPSGRKGYLGERMMIEDILPPVLMPFEDGEFYVVNNVTKYLELLYGKDYMQLPPEEKRERHFVVELKI